MVVPQYLLCFVAMNETLILCRPDVIDVVEIEASEKMEPAIQVIFRI